MDISFRYRVTIPVRFTALGALLTSFLSSFISSATGPFISSSSTMPHPWCVRSSLARSLADCVPFPSERTHVVVRHVVARVRVALCHLRIALPKSTVDDVPQFLHDFVEISRPFEDSRAMSFGIVSLTTVLHQSLRIDARTRPLSITTL